MPEQEKPKFGHYPRKGGKSHNGKKLGRPPGKPDSKPRTWNERMYVKAYIAAREGVSEKHIARVLGVAIGTLRKMMEDRPAFREAVEMGRQHTARSGKGAVKNITQYVGERMPQHVRELWDKINSFWEEKDREKRVQVLLSGQSKQIKQHLFLHGLIACNFNKTEAAKKMNLPYPTIQAWCHDPTFQQLVGHIVDMKKDFVEGCLLNLVASGDTTATIFAAKSLLSDRGYNPKVTVKHEGGVMHGHVSLDKVLESVDVATQRKILAAIRHKQSPKALPAHQVEDEEEVEDAEYEEVDDG